MSDKNKDYEERDEGFLGYPLPNESGRRQFYEPWYNDKTDYNTNAPSYYDYLARMHKLIHLLADRIWEYDKELAKRFEEWDKLIEKFPENVENLLIEWMKDGTLDEIINENIFKNLNSKIDNNTEKINKVINDLKNAFSNSQDVFLSNLHKLDQIGQTGTRAFRGDTKYPQSVAINQEDNTFYILRQTTGSVNDKTLYEYRLGKNDELLRKRELPFDIDAYVEGLAYRKNQFNELEFIIPTKKHGEKYIVYNFDTDNYVQGKAIEMSYKSNMDNNGRYYITVKTDYPNQDPNSKATGLNIYDLDSMFNRRPELVRTVSFSRKHIIGDYKIQSLGMIDNMIIFSQGESETLTTVMDLDGNILKRITFDKQELSTAMGLSDSGISNDQVFEPEGTFYYKYGGNTYLLELICSQGQACLMRHGFPNKGKPVKETLLTTYSIEDLPANQAMLDNGTPRIVFQDGDDILNDIENIKNPGLYFVVAVGSVKNKPMGTSTMTGWVYLRSTRHTGANADRAIIELTDLSGRKFSNNMDTNRNQKWFGWQQFAGIPVVGDEKISNLRKDITIPGKYYFMADDVRRIEDMPEKYTSLGAVIKHEKISGTFVIQTAYRLNPDTGYGPMAMRTIADGEIARESGESDSHGWRYFTTTPD